MAPLELKETPQGVLLAVKVQPRSRRPGFQGVHAGGIRLGVKEPPERGKANQAVARLLAEALQVAPGAIKLLRGATSSRKEFLIQGLSADQVRRRLEPLLGRE